MDSLRKVASSLIDRPYLFETEAPENYCTVELLQHADTETQLTVTETTGDSLVSWAEALFSTTSNNVKPASRLKMLVVSRPDFDSKLKIKRQVFEGVFKCFRLDPYVLELYFGFSEGVHLLPPCRSRNEEPEILTFYVMDPYLCVFWAFCPSTGATGAIFIPRYDHMLTRLKEKMELYKEIASHPMFLYLASVSSSIQKIQQDFFEKYGAVERVAEGIGYSDWVEAEVETKSTDYSQYTKDIGQAALRLSIIRAEVSAIKDNITTALRCQEECWGKCPGERQAILEPCHEDFKSILLFMEASINQIFLDIEHKLEQIRTLLTVVCLGHSPIFKW